MLLDTKGAVPAVETTRALWRPTEIDFYLTGSRYFGCARPDSDWDFMVQDSPEVREFLKGLGFVQRVAPQYASNLTTEVWEVQDGHVTIQVQLSQDVQKKRAVRDFLATAMSEQHRKANREERMWLWGQLAEIIQFVPLVDRTHEVGF